MTTPTVLFVDDEKNVLDSFRRSLRGKYLVETFQDPTLALAEVKTGKEFSVVVADMQMPRVSGVEFLSLVRTVAPDTVRVMLTGNVDQGTAVSALNQGSIFRFLNKPCPPAMLLEVLEAATKQYSLITAERELLNHTLTGSVKVLTDILALSDPETFNHALRIRPLLKTLAAKLGASAPWDIELAAMLAPLGRVVVPSEVLSKYRRGDPLTAQEAELLSSVPGQSKKLIESIPRLAGVAAMVLYHAKDFNGKGFPADGIEGQKMPLGARIIHAASDFEALRAQGIDDVTAIQRLEAKTGAYDPDVLRELRLTIRPSEGSLRGTKTFSIRVRDLCPGQVLISDLVPKDGLLLMGKGGMVTEMMIRRVQNYEQIRGIQEPIEVDVLTPTRDEALNKGV